MTLVLAAALVAAGLTACGGGTAGPGATPGPTAAPGVTATAEPPATGDVLTVRRTGGIAGVDQRLTLQSDGAWTYSDARAGGTQRGTLTPAQLAQLRTLVGQPGFAAEGRLSPAAGCADAFAYEVALGDLAVQFSDCPASSSHPIASSILALLTDATPL